MKWQYGLSLKKSRFKTFKEKIEKHAKSTNIDKILPIIYIDRQVSSKHMDINVIKQLGLLEPFGEGNKAPIFIYKNLKIDSIRALTEGKHLKLTLKDENNVIIHGIGFNKGYLADEYLIDNKVDIVGEIEVNNFNNREIIQINIKDIMKSI